MADAGYGRSSARHRRAQPPARPVVWPPLPLPGAEILDRNSSYRSWVAPFTPFSRRLARGASVTRGGHPFRVSVSVAEALLSWSDNRHVVLACDLTAAGAAPGSADAVYCMWLRVKRRLTRPFSGPGSGWRARIGCPGDGLASARTVLAGWPVSQPSAAARKGCDGRGMG